MRPDKSTLIDYFDYDSKGFLVWKPREGNTQFNKCFSGKIAGYKQSSGHLNIELLGEVYGSHVLIYAWHTGEWPEIVDHKDKNPSNSRIENLRPATPSQNACNQKLRKDNKLGIKNVSLQRNGTYLTRVTKDGVTHGKSFTTLEEAIAWRNIKLVELHGEFASIG